MRILLEKNALAARIWSSTTCHIHSLLCSIYEALLNTPTSFVPQVHADVFKLTGSRSPKQKIADARVKPSSPEFSSRAVSPTQLPESPQQITSQTRISFVHYLLLQKIISMNRANGQCSRPNTFTILGNLATCYSE